MAHTKPITSTIMTTTTEAVCCPRFDPAPWDGTTVVWDNKRFITDRVFTFLYMPINFGGAMRRLGAKVDSAKASVPDWLCLSEHTSMWKMNLYLAVDHDIPQAESTTISGKFYCKVYEGPFSDTGKWVKDFNAATAAKGLKCGKMFFWYTTCPQCAKKYGKNYVVILAQID